MIQKSKMWLSLIAVFMVSLGSGTLSADDPKSGDQIVKDFLAHVDALSIDDNLKQEVKILVNELWEDEYTKSETVTGGLTKIYPAYGTALESTQDEELASAIQQLKPFLSSQDKFLAADASFFLARSLMNEQQHEAALPILETLSSDMLNHSLHTGPAVYFSGVAQASLLENQRAIKSFTAFLNEYENAPERLRVAAWRQIQTIQKVEQGTMTDVLQRMDYSRRRLEIENTNEDTQTQQERVVSMLGKLIKKEEKKECSNCNSKKNSENKQGKEAKGSSGKKGQGKSDSGGASNNSNGVVRRSYDDGPASPWSQLRDRSRDPANNAVKERLPARYKRVVEKYYGKTSGNDSDK